MNKCLIPNIFGIVIAAMLISLTACRQDDIVYPPEVVPVTPSESTSITGFYLLNEGNMGSNKCSLDYFDYTSGEYMRNIYGSANPDVPKELGDVGNDLKIYGEKMYAVVNCSNKVEVMRTADTRRVGQIDIPNCRYIAFDGPYAYVTSYAGPVKIEEDYKQLGYVAKVDTASLAVVDTVTVGYQPDQLAISDGKIYVANSGGYRVPNYENTMSVIDIATFKVEATVEVGINLSKVVADKRGRIWVASRGDYFTVPSQLFCYDPQQGEVIRTFDIPVSAMWLDGDDLYIVATAWSSITMSNEVSSCVVNTLAMAKTRDTLITDGTDTKIKVPFGVAVHPVTKEVIITDARTYVNPGYVYCFHPDGTLKWSARTGDIPSKIAFTRVPVTTPAP